MVRQLDVETDFILQYEFVLAVCDQEPLCTTSTLTLTVTDDNDSPVFVNSEQILMINENQVCYLPQKGQGNVFTRVCHFVHGRICLQEADLTTGGLPPGVCLHSGVCLQLTPSRTRKSGGTHPTGMLFCFH